MEGFGGVMEGATGLGGFDGVKVRRCHRRFRRCHRRCDDVIEGFGGVIEVATELGDFDGSIEVATAP